MMMASPLDGVQVLDLSKVVSGPFCTQILADMGADVIKVEPPGGDDTRHFGPPFVEGISTYYLANNRGKRSIVVDLNQRTGREIVERLARWANVVVANYRPGVAEKLGVGYQQLCSHNPTLIYANISGFGMKGESEYSTLAGYDLVLQGMGGMPALTGPVDGKPYKIAGSMADIIAAQNAFGAITASLYALEKTGKGQFLDISMYDGQLSVLMYHATAWLNAEIETKRQGNAHQSLCPYEVFEAKDGYFTLACGTDEQFRKLCEAIDEDGLAKDPRFETNKLRVKNRESLLDILKPEFTPKTVGSCLELLAKAGVAAGPIQSVVQALEHPQAEARGMIIRQSHEVLGEVQTVRSALGFNKQVFSKRPPPLLGEHTRDILTNVLQYTQSQIEYLENEKVVTSLKRGRAL